MEVMKAPRRKQPSVSASDAFSPGAVKICEQPPAGQRRALVQRVNG